MAPLSYKREFSQITQLAARSTPHWRERFWMRVDCSIFPACCSGQRLPPCQVRRVPPGPTSCRNLPRTSPSIGQKQSAGAARYASELPMNDPDRSTAVTTTKSRWRTLMVATGTTDASAGPLLGKALQLAQRFDASLRLVHVIEPTYTFVPDELKLHSTRLDELVEKKLRRAGVEVATTVVRDFPPADAIVRQVLEHEPDLLIAESHRHGKLARALLDQTDWELIRNCPCPLWLSKSSRLSPDARILAAIDPFHSRAKPARLDDIILRTALQVAGGRPEKVIACHAYTPPSVVMPAMTAELYWQPLSEKELRRYETNVRRTVDRRLARYRIPPRNRLAVPGDPPVVLARLAKKRRVGLIVMGAISRSALTRFFIGSTAERVIDDVQCDVLVVKSAGFRTRVSRRMTRPVLGYPAVPMAGPATARQ